MVRRSQPRRGVVILVVLSLLVLFVLLAVTYAIVAGQYDRIARSYARQDLFGEDPARLADRVMYELVRGTNRVTSPLRGHDLLQDKYGESFRTRLLTHGDLRAGGQFIEFAVELSAYQEHPSGYYNGRVLTFLDGPSAGLSTRIVVHRVHRTDLGQRVDRFRVLTPQPDQNVVRVPQRGNTILVNGAPFAGTGPGFNPNYDPDSTTPENVTGLTEHALLPNRVGERPEDFENNYRSGGMNEGYDAADYQNMALAAVTEDFIIPSFHRPALIWHWMNDNETSSSTVPELKRSEAWNTGNPTVRRRVIFRPMPWDHPNFTGSNPAFDGQEQTDKQIERALLRGPWDVDNNNDGRPDSIWIDPGFAPQTAPDGRLYKPLVAILCQDLDGRLNVNAHGSYDHLDLPEDYDHLGNLPVRHVPLADGATTANLPRGQGFGPAEINLNALIQDEEDYRRVLLSRYAANQVPGRSRFDLLAAPRFYEYPYNFFDPYGELTSFSSFFDLRGVQSFGVDHRGQPLSAFVYEYDDEIDDHVFPDLLADNPYEFRLVHPGGHDQPFTLAELERVLRHDDVDAHALPSRLWDLISILPADPSARQAITTHSFDPPVPGVLASNDFHAVGLNPPRSILEMLADRLREGGVPENRLDLHIEYLLSPDLARGLRMDINRPLGSGRDSNDNWIVDEHWGPTEDPALSESLLVETVDLADRPTNPPLSDPPLMVIDHDNDGVIGEEDEADLDAFLVRYHLARHLYVLAMLLKDEDFLYLGDAEPAPPANGDDNGDDNGGGGNGGGAAPIRDPEETARILAQWAINVVTFRDADSIMYPFEYDPYPFDYDPDTEQTWNVDGILETDEGAHRRIVWGAERPELLLTETLALHDFRTELLDEIDDDDPEPVEFQQRLMPRGSLFIEIYNPWTGHANPPAEFYSDGVDWSPGVVLNKRNAADHPVWRLAITPLRFELDEPRGADIERTVFFAPPPRELAEMADMGDQVHFANADLAPLLPGRYAVVGPGGITTIGRRTDGDYQDGPTGIQATRQITLEVNPDYEQHQVQVKNNQQEPGGPGDLAIPDSPTLPPTDGQPVEIQPAIAIPVDWIGDEDDNRRLPLSMSEPLGGYPREYNGSEFDEQLQQGDGAYVPHLSSPIDDTIHGGSGNPFTRGPEQDDGSYQLGTSLNHRRIHLQRLANPLAPYHPVTNPYRTIDSMPVDLHRFNGVTADQDVSAGAGVVDLATFERGDNERNLWAMPLRSAHEPQDDPEDDPEDEPQDDPQENEDTAVHFMDQQLGHSLGFLNEPFWPYYTSANAPPVDLFAVTSYVGAPITDDVNPAFPWLVWNNRPYISPHELLQVPASSSARLLRDFSLFRDEVDPYGPEPEFESGSFGHLKNFFFSSDHPGMAPNLYRLFEFVHTRSPFIDAEKFLNPWAFIDPEISGTEGFRPPFNRISRYRDPGRINLNTIYDSRVWAAIWGDHSGPNFEDFKVDRRGYADTGPDDLPPASAPYPSRFNKAYRPPGSGAMVPPMGPKGKDLRPPDMDIDGTLMRTRWFTEVEQDWVLTDEIEPFFAPRKGDDDPAAWNRERHSYFAYQALQRLPNLVTTRSNVYAVWLTIGYFEVEPNLVVDEDTGDERIEITEFHPDGYRLGQELGLDTGEVRRHRAFYIIDRTIPVAFEPGQNHNVDRAVLLRRFIE